ncbi:MAG: F0F1 ATP synthase subunit B [Buchnera aphidicola (Floraphis choui)]
MNLNATIIGQAISFFLFTFFCMKYIWPPIMFAIKNRQKEISDSLLYIKNSKKKLDSYRNKIDDEINIIRNKTKTMIDQAKKKKIIILNEAHVQAQKEREKILEKTQFDVKIAYQQLRHKLIKEISQIAINISEKIIEHKINNEKTQNIIDSLIKKL